MERARSGRVPARRRGSPPSDTLIATRGTGFDEHLVLGRLVRHRDAQLSIELALLRDFSARDEHARRPSRSRIRHKSDRYARQIRPLRANALGVVVESRGHWHPTASTGAGEASRRQSAEFTTGASRFTSSTPRNGRATAFGWHPSDRLLDPLRRRQEDRAAGASLSGERLTRVPRGMRATSAQRLPLSPVSVGPHSHKIVLMTDTPNAPIALVKPSKPISQMSDEERHAFAEEIFKKMKATTEERDR